MSVRKPNIIVRPARPEECAALSELCLRSKGWWGYDAAFLEACRDELTIRPPDLGNLLRVAECDGKLAGLRHLCPPGVADVVQPGHELTFADDLARVERERAGEDPRDDAIALAQAVTDIPDVPMVVKGNIFAYNSDFGGFITYPDDLKGLITPQNLWAVYLAK